MRKQKPTAPRGVVRIIAGQWRGRKLDFPALEGLRPTADRIRETLFNWLVGELPGARCLDLFAGSGALGLEALSRGAGHCTFVDAEADACRAISRHLNSLGDGDRGRCVHARAEQFLPGDGVWDIVFVDPPFSAGLALPILGQLLATKALHRDSLVYLETARDHPLALPTGFASHREKVAGEVSYRLLRPSPDDCEPRGICGGI